jgi:hypothetical protein
MKDDNYRQCLARWRLFPMGRKGRTRQILFLEPRVVNTDVPFTSFGWVSLILIPDTYEREAKLYQTPEDRS